MLPAKLALADKTALIVGGSRGIGLAIAELFAKQGIRVVIMARSAASLREAVAQIGENTLAITADIADPESVREAFAQLKSECSGLDFLINCAAVADLIKVEQVSDALIEHHMRTNVMGMIYCCREAIPLLRRSSCATIINMSSDSVSDPFPYLTLYATTKGAVEAFTKALRRELKADGIRVTLVRPGPTTTSFASSWNPELFGDAIEVWHKGGYLKLNEDGGSSTMQASTVAESILNIVNQPLDSYVEFMEIRPR